MGQIDCSRLIVLLGKDKKAGRVPSTTLYMGVATGSFLASEISARKFFKFYPSLDRSSQKFSGPC